MGGRGTSGPHRVRLSGAREGRRGARQGLVGAAVQAFFSYRTWIVSNTIWFAIPGWFAELIRAGVSIAITVITIQIGELDEFKAQYKWLVIFTVSSFAENGIRLS